jgi:hypothetical protein
MSDPRVAVYLNGWEEDSAGLAKAFEIQAETATTAGCIRICIRFLTEGFFNWRLTEGIPVLA